MDEFIITSVDDELVASATPLAVKYALPSADCLQLASVVNLRNALKPEKEELVLLCSDKDLYKAAQKEGIAFIDPEEKDALERLSAVLD